MNVKELIQELSKLPGDTLVATMDEEGDLFALDSIHDIGIVWVWEGKRDCYPREYTFKYITYSGSKSWHKEDKCLGEFKVIRL